MPPLETRSLRTRVAVLVLAMLAVALLGLGVLVHLALGVQLRSELRGRLTDRASFARVLDGSLTGQQLADRLSGQGVAVTVTDTAGTTYAGRTAATTPTPDPPGPGKPPRPPAVAPAAPVAQTGDLLTVTEELPTAGTVVLSASEADVRATLQRLAVLETVASLVLLAVAGLVAGRLVGAALRPLDRMTALARSSAEGRRGDRLRPTRPGTEIGRTAAAFDAMLDGLEESAARARAAEDRLRRFLADAGHELRTPVTGLQLTTETLLSADLDDAEREQLTLAAVRTARRAGRLVDDLLLMARAEDGEAPVLLRDDVDVVELATDAVRRARLASPDLKVRLARGAATAVVRGDGARLAQVLDNLLDNARHASPAWGRVDVAVGLGDGRVRIAVTDQGRGVPSADAERVFERLVRLEPGAYAGTGLGLPLARLLARAHGGDVRCVPSQAGARFEVVLPTA